MNLHEVSEGSKMGPSFPSGGWKKLYRNFEGFETGKEVIRSDLQDHSKHNGLGRGAINGCRTTEERQAVT